MHKWLNMHMDCIGLDMSRHVSSMWRNDECNVGSTMRGELQRSGRGWVVDLWEEVGERRSSHPFQLKNHNHSPNYHQKTNLFKFFSSHQWIRARIVSDRRRSRRSTTRCCGSARRTSGSAKETTTGPRPWRRPELRWRPSSAPG